jgi:ribosomal protein S18
MKRNNAFWLVILQFFFLVDVIRGFRTLVQSGKLHIQPRFHENNDYNSIGKSSFFSVSSQHRYKRSLPDGFPLFSTKEISSINEKSSTTGKEEKKDDDVEYEDEKPARIIYSPRERYLYAIEKNREAIRHNEQKLNRFRFKDFKRPAPVPKRLLYKKFLNLQRDKFHFCNIELLNMFLTNKSKIKPRLLTKIPILAHKKIENFIKKARNFGVIPYCYDATLAKQHAQRHQYHI